MTEWILLSSVLLLLFVLDDLFIDFYSLVKNLKPLPFTKAPTGTVANAPLAIMVANWKEQDVLESMVRANSHILFDKNVHLFLGVYPNDTQTAEVAFNMAKRYEQVHVVVNRTEGPTYKGQMLNEVIRYIFEFENRTGTEYAGFIIHDAEDVISSLSMTLYREGLSRADFIQLPVFSLPLKWNCFVGGTYLDEFAESHSKDLLVRQSLQVGIPSAGVGTCLSKKLVQTFCNENGGLLFKDKDLTEDYILGMQAYKKGFKSIFSCYYPAQDPNGRVIATREYFPNGFRASIRQKTRWTLGVSLQGWKKLGWFGNLWQRYFLWRDRKALFATFLNLNSFAVLGVLSTTGSPELFQDPVIPAMLTVNMTAMSLRISMRMRWTLTYYGLTAALMVPLRWPLATVINTLAGLRAVAEYTQSAVFNTELTWKKTEHQFPTDLALFEEPSRPLKEQESHL